LLVFAALATSAGCASLDPSQWLPASLPSAGQEPIVKQGTYRERKETAIKSFAQQQERAQIQAAVHSWQRGETQRSQAMLTAVISSNPHNTIARLRLAEILVSQQESAAAEEQLRACLDVDPDLAEAQHALGMLLSEWSGREAEAAAYLRRACELEPQNDIYSATTAY
jgi:Tfp pilus assembly protein PilF